MGLPRPDFAKTLPAFNNHFPEEQLQSLWAEAQPKDYVYKMKVWLLPQILMSAFVMRLPSLDAIVAEFKAELNIKGKATLSDMLRNIAFARLLTMMLDRAGATQTPRSDTGYVILDSMADTIPRRRLRKVKSLRRKGQDPEKYNNKTLGGGMLWAFMPNTPPGACPVQWMQTMRGAWNDSRVLSQLSRSVMVPGPVYLMDRGFYSLELVRQWLERGIHFVSRAKKRSLVYKRIRCAGRKKRYNGMKVVEDGVVELGAKNPVVVRMLWVELPTGEDLILISNRLEAVGQWLLDSYRLRWQIERFHSLLKSSLGLAHLYSFGKVGMEVLGQVLVLLAILMWKSARKGVREGQTLVQRLLEILAEIRRPLTSRTPWRRNMTNKVYAKCKKRAKAAT